MFDYLQALSDAGLIGKLVEEVEHLYQNAPNMTEQLAKMFNISAYEPKDDFEQMFESHATNMLYFTFLMLILIVDTTYETLLIYYEKFGADPMKRSLRNQLIAQTGYLFI